MSKSKISLQELYSFQKSMEKVLAVNVIDTFIQQLALNFIASPSAEADNYSDDLLDLAREDHDNGVVDAQMEDMLTNPNISEQYLNYEFHITGFCDGEGDWKEQSITFTKIEFNLHDNSTFVLTNNTDIENAILRRMNGFLFSEFDVPSI